MHTAKKATTITRNTRSTSTVATMTTRAAVAAGGSRLLSAARVSPNAVVTPGRCQTAGMSSPILITGTIDFDPAFHDDVVAAAKVAMAVSAQEAGCELYVMAADLSDPGRFHLSERWTDAESLAAHSAAPERKDFRRALRDAGAKGNSITRWDGATGSQLA